MMLMISILSLYCLIAVKDFDDVDHDYGGVLRELPVDCSEIDRKIIDFCYTDHWHTQAKESKSFITQNDTENQYEMNTP